MKPRYTKRVREEAALIDCRGCGACCVGGYDDGCGFASVLKPDLDRMSSHIRNKLNARSVGGEVYFATPSSFTEEFGASCSFLRGTPGRRVSCGIYDSRPDVCRKYIPGSRLCKAARAELGLTS